MLENQNKFIEYLRFQISRKFKSDQIVKKIPMFSAKLDDGSAKILQMIDYFEDMKRREIYVHLVQEFNKVIQK